MRGVGRVGAASVGSIAGLRVHHEAQGPEALTCLGSRDGLTTSSPRGQDGARALKLWTLGLTQG